MALLKREQACLTNISEPARMLTSTQGSNWYLLQCKPRQDERAQINLLRQNYVIFCPQIISERLIHGKPHQSLESLFPGYLFIQLSRDDKWAPLRSTRGVSRIVDFNHGPATVPDDVIEHLRIRCFKPPELHTPQPFKPGETLQITRGPLSTLEGIFLSMLGDERVMILLHFLNREHQVRVPLTDIERPRPNL
ncbi:transcription elongation factor/antiterminator RfaH [Pseudomonas sp. F-14 TE3623]